MAFVLATTPGCDLGTAEGGCPTLFIFYLFTLRPAGRRRYALSVRIRIP